MTSPAPQPPPTPQHAAAPYAATTPTLPTGQPMCRICAASPAAPVTFRRHQGLLIWLGFASLTGPFCRTCGTAVFREFTSRSTWQGWWSPFSLVINPVVLISNRCALARVNKLTEPEPAPDGRASWTPGTPVLRRRSSLAALVPVLWAIWAVVGILTEVY
ncbi:hypothetical protein [Streptomyces sp. NPDC002611]